MPAHALLGQILLGRYRPLRELGAGAHGRVFLAEDLVRGGERVALKIVEGLIGGGMETDAQRALRWFRHPAWAEVLDEGRFGRYDWFQAMRFVDGHSLAELAGPQPAEHVWRFLEDAARVLRALHMRGLIHYDVTPGNWLREQTSDGPRFVLTDGGLANLGPVHGFARGTPLYLAPEVTADRPHDHRVDLYSLGLVAYHLATGGDAHQGGAGEVLGERRRGPAPHPRERRPELPADLDLVIAALLEPDPERRVASAEDLLGRIRDARPDTPEVLPSETVATSTSGPIVGRDEALTRFGRSLRALSEHHAAEGALPSPSLPAPEPVLLLEGAPGAGGTRLARELAAAARREEIPVMLLAGREGSPDRRNPLRRLVDGLVTLRRPGASAAEPVVLADRAKAADADTSAHAEGRAIERFLSVVEEAARRTPFVLVVEDLSDLPHLAQEAVRVLSRHLLGRAERISGQAPLPITLVVDLGREPSEPLVNADAADARRAVVPLPPLTADEVAALCRDRFPGLDLAQGDIERLLATTDGQPAVLSGLLAQAYGRGDLKPDGGAWTWDLSRLGEYGAVRRLPPALEEALRSAPPVVRAWLDRLALAECEMPERAAHALWQKVASGSPTPTSLVSVREHGETVVITLVSPALRRALQEALDPAARRTCAADLVSVLDEHPDPHTLLDRIALRAELGRAEDALALATAQRARLTAEQRLALQPLLLRLADAHPALLDHEAQRHDLVLLLDRGPQAAALARHLAPRLPASEEALPDVLLVAQTLDTSHEFAATEALLRTHATTQTSDPALAAAVQVGLARALFSLRRPQDANAPLARARVILRSLARPRLPAHARLVVDYLKARGNRFYDADNLAHARRVLDVALRITRRTRARLLHVTVLNNLGLVQLGDNDFRGAERSLERALRLRLKLGDVAGAVGGLLNIAQVHLASGRPAVAVARLQLAAGLATRHAYVGWLISVLSRLGSALDQQFSSTAALECYSRGLRASRRARDLVRGAQVAHRMAPLAAALGSGGAVREALAVSASAAHSRAFVDARPLHHLATAQCALARGLFPEATESLKRSQRSRNSLKDSDVVTLQLVAALVGASSGRPFLGLPPRPRRAAPMRGLYRVTLRRLRVGKRRSEVTSVAALTARLLAGASRVAPDERRLLVEHVIADPAWTKGRARAQAFRRAGELLARTGMELHRARLNALQARVEEGASLGQRTALLSRAIAILPLFGSHLPRRLSRTPDEIISASRSLAEAAGVTLADELDGAHLHAVAHALLTQAPPTDVRGARREEALRQVLAATSKMEPGAELEALLDRLTRSTADITGAQRACVVLVESDAPGQMRVATSVTTAGGPLTDQDLSHTVIQRVLASRTPLLLHDAFTDDELLSKPSITTLALRSILCVPMLRDGALLGVMYADSSAGAGSFDNVDLEVLSLLADQAASAISTNRLVHKLQRAYSDVRTMQDRLVRSERLRVIGEVSSGVAHEFNNLLTAILARVQLMGLAELEQEQRAHLDLIEKATLDAAGVVRRLQTFSRTQRTQTFVPVPVGEVCTDAIEFLRPLWSTRRRHGRPPIIVRALVEPGLRVQGNPTELREVLTNLIKNSIDALTDRGGTVMIRAVAEGRFVDLQVQDDGPGIRPEVLPRVFDPFFTTKGERGTGLGLCLSQKIAEQHGGELHLESVFGQGTTARLRLPVATAAPRSEGGLAAHAGPTDPDAHNLSVLIVDDDSDVLRPLCAYLERSGYAVAAAQSGEHALDLLREAAPDVLLTDIGMPAMDGLELCRRAIALDPQLPVVLMSGWASEVDPASARAAGAQALLAKPFAMQQVSDLLQRVTSRPPSGS
jgi:signal transduction histidine kinase/CheY-like chemotaxis protein/tetratricopeptide (TPR) repeat protein